MLVTKKSCTVSFSLKAIIAAEVFSEILTNTRSRAASMKPGSISLIAVF